jgi:ABC-type polysaccharide/polyol phosphate export permease
LAGELPWYNTRQEVLLASSIGSLDLAAYVIYPSALVLVIVLFSSSSLVLSSLIAFYSAYSQLVSL